MKKKLIKHGNSLALIIDKPILKLLGVKQNYEFEIKIDGNKLILKPVCEDTIDFSSKDKRKMYEEIIKKYDADFKKLAE